MADVPSGGSTNRNSPGNVNVLLYEQVLNISYILYFREINI